MTLVLDPSTEALAQRTAELVIERLKSVSLNAAPAETQEVLTRTEAMHYVKKRSEGAFCEWCQRWGVKPRQRGRYSRTRLDLALDRERRAT
jgi:hypothetical protein